MLKPRRPKSHTNGLSICLVAVMDGVPRQQHEDEDHSDHHERWSSARKHVCSYLLETCRNRAVLRSMPFSWQCRRGGHILQALRCECCRCCMTDLPGLSSKHASRRTPDRPRTMAERTMAERTYTGRGRLCSTAQHWAPQRPRCRIRRLSALAARWHTARIAWPIRAAGSCPVGWGGLLRCPIER